VDSTRRGASMSSGEGETGGGDLRSVDVEVAQEETRTKEELGVLR